MNARQKARDLIELACDDRTPDKERLAAALKACKTIRDHDLLASPLDGLLSSENETVQAATDIFSRLTDPKLVKSMKKVVAQVRRRSYKR